MLSGLKAVAVQIVELAILFLTGEKSVQPRAKASKLSIPAEINDEASLLICIGLFSVERVENVVNCVLCAMSLDGRGSHTGGWAIV